MKFLMIILVLCLHLLAENNETDFFDELRNNKIQTDATIDKWAENFNDMNDTLAKKIMQNKVKGVFGLKPYDKNYILPLTYTRNQYESYVPGETYSKAEAEIQISLQYDAFSNIFGFGEIYSFAYTQRSMWQIYADSSPFRETNYKPEFFVTIPLTYKNDYFKLDVIRFSVTHESNGQSNIADSLDSNVSLVGVKSLNRSRSWNYVSAMVVAQHKSLFVGLKGWLRIPEKAEDDDNPDITSYIGNAEVFFLYPIGQSFYKGDFKFNLQTGKGSTELSYSYPLANQENVYFFTKFFTGYGDSLIDYDNYLTKASIGLSFSR